MTVTIDITTKKQMDIYMNPQRQRLLKEMSIYGKPITPKQLSNILNISPSSVTYHLKKLQELGIVELDHTEMVHGICAKYYKKLPHIFYAVEYLGMSGFAAKNFLEVFLCITMVSVAVTGAGSSSC